ncbi:MAG: site-2 protease family protein [Firmicutes bacterium]|nr:site-2 protease family protein [Bacillota bacterium]
MEYFLYLLLAIVILLAMVVIHELGHYLVGKWLRFDITEFSVGFGPKLLQKRLKNGEKFTLRLLPLGGYCAFVDESGQEQDKIEQANAKDMHPHMANDDATTETVSSEQGETLAMVSGEGAPAQVEKEQGASLVARKPVSFVAQKPWKRLLVFVAGAGFNFLSAILFTFLYILVVGFAVPSVVDVYQNPSTGIAYNDLKINDQILAIDGHRLSVMENWSDLVDKAQRDWVKQGNDVDSLVIQATILRDGQEKTVTLKRQMITQTDENGNIVYQTNDKGDPVYQTDENGNLVYQTDENGGFVLDENGRPQPQKIPVTYQGFGFANYAVSKNVGFGDSVAYSVPLTLKFSWMILGSLGSMFTGAVGLNEISGPISTVGAIATVSEANPLNILVLLPLIAANLAIFNLLPIPALDGSKVVFTIIEWIRKKPIKRSIENAIHLVGLALLLGFVVLIELLKVV